MGLRIAALREYLRTSLWFIPFMLVIVTIATAVATLKFDSSGYQLPAALGFSGSASSARALLAAIAGAIITLTALAFSITVIVLQLASSQYSPRVLRTFLRDRTSQVVLAVFMSSFVYAMMVLRAVRTDGDEGGPPAFIPEASVNLAFLLTGVSLVFFVIYVHHIARSMQASTIVADVAHETATTIERLYPSTGKPVADVRYPPASEPPEHGRDIHVTKKSGYLQAINQEEVLHLAKKADVTIEVLPRIGDFVAKHSVLFRVYGSFSEKNCKKLFEAITLGKQRTMQQDAAFGFRQLVDIAEKALSPGINDPTSAVQSIDRIHEMLLLLADRDLPSPQRADEEGKLRAIFPAPSWESYVRMAFDEIRHYGAGSVQISRRLKWMAESVLEAVDESRKPPLRLQLYLIDESTKRSFLDPADVEHAKISSRHG